jgi:hypothetical protein
MQVVGRCARSADEAIVTCVGSRPLIALAPAARPPASSGVFPHHPVHVINHAGHTVALGCELDLMDRRLPAECHSYLSAGLPPLVLKVSEQVLRDIPRCLPAKDTDMVRSQDKDWMQHSTQPEQDMTF